LAAWRWIAGGVAALVLVVAVAWEAGALNGVALWAAGRVLGYDISCSRLTGGLLSRFTCTDLRLADAKGRFLEAREFALDWNPWALLGNEAQLTRVRMADATLTRLPAGTSQSSSNDFLPGTTIAIGALDVRHLVLAMTDAPDACLALGGRGAIGPDGFDAALTLIRCAPDRGRLAFTGHYEKASGALTLSVLGRDDGALATAITGIKRAGATTIAMRGSGTVAAFTGRLDVQVAGIGRTVARFGARNLSSTHVDARFALAPAVRPSWAPRGEGRIAADLVRGSEGGFAINSATLGWGGWQGALGLRATADGALEGSAVLKSAMPVALAGTTVAGIDAHAQIGGTDKAPIVLGAVTLSGVTRGASAIGTVQANFRVDGGPGGLMRANVVGHAKNAALPAPLGGLFGDAFGFHGTASRGADGALAIGAALNGAAADLTAHAELGEANGGGRVSLAVPDLAKAQAGLAGSASADLTFGRFTLAGDMDGTLRVRGLHVVSQGLGAALGPAPVLTAKLHAQGGNFKLSGLVLETAAATAHGSASLTAAGRLNANLKTSRGNLAPFSKLLGRPLRGAFALRATARGTAAQPSLALNVHAPRFTFAGRKIENAALKFEARKQAEWRAQLGLNAATPAGPVAFAANAQMTRAGWRLDVTKGALGPATLAGGLSRSRQKLTGSLTLTGDVLQPVGLFLGRPMRGTGTLSLGGDGKAIRLTAKFKNLAAGPLARATLKLKATAAALNKPIALSLSIKDGANRLAAAATATLSPARVTFDTLKGDWAAKRFALAHPATLSMKNGSFKLSRTAMGISGGTLTVAAAGGRDALTASVEVARIPAAPLAALLQLGTAEGTVGLQFRAALSRRKTDVQLTFDATGLKFGRASRKVEPANVKLAANWNGATLTADGRVTGLDAQPATLSARVPVVRAHGGYMPKLASSGPVSVRLRAQLRAERLMAILPVAEQTASGDLTASADVTGDIANPQISGRIALAKGSYGNFETGTKLENVNASVEASGTNKALLSLTATDGNSGTVKAKGELSLAALEAGGPSRLAGHIDLTLNKARVLREDLIDASATGALSLDLAAGQPPKITGKLRTETVRIDLGAAIPPEVPEIEVKEINGGGASAPPPTKPSIFSKAALNVALTMPNRIYVSGRGVDSEWSGNFKVAGTIAVPDISGKLTLVRGQAELIGKTFTLKEGSVVPDRSVKGGATVHLVAENESSDITVTVTADGPVADPKLTWTSSPALPRDEILSRLFFGKSTPHISAFQALQLAQLSGQLGSLGGLAGGGAGVLSFARRLTGLDVLRVEAPSDLNGAGASVAAGRYITDNVYVGVKQGANTSAGTAQVEVKVTPHIALDAEAGANSQGSLGVTWKWDY
jgi:translocation and assembly module TamB